MKVVWDESGFGWKWFGMKVVLDENGFGMKVVLDETGFGMKVVLDENFWDEKRQVHPNLDETVPNQKDVGLDGLRVVCLIERVEDPPVLSQHRGIGQGDATGMSPSSPSVAVRRASREMMHEGAVRVMAEGASGRALPVTRGTAWRSGHGPQRARPRRHDREEVVRESVNKDAMQVRHTGREPVTKGTVKTRIDFTGKPSVE